MAKGAKFERDICKRLSRWWTNNKRDDVFRRSATSGGTATQRAKSGKKTFGQYGDIAIADPIGQPLLDLCAIELKTGYSTYSPMDMIDRMECHHPKYEKFFLQAIQQWNQSDSVFWLLIARRSGRRIMVYMPYRLYDRWDPLMQDLPNMLYVRSKYKRANKTYALRTVGIPLDDFFRRVKSRDIRALLRIVRK
jgi:hypothetical protein